MAVFWQGWMRYLLGGLWNPEKGIQRPGPTGYANAAKVAISDDRALQIAAVFRCIRIIAETCATLPLITYKKTATGREPTEDHWLAKLLAAPNETQTGDEWRESVIAQIAGWGNAYGQIVRQSMGRPVELWNYKTDRMKVERRENRTLQYTYPDIMGVPKELKTQDVLHMRGFSVDGVMGVSPLGVARETLGLAVGAENYAASFFASGGRPSGILSTDRLLQPEQREKLAQQFGGLAEGGTEKRLWVLEAALKYEPISVSPEDMQMLQTRAFQIADIARFFGVPLFLLMETEKSTSWGSGIEQQNLAFLTYTLMPYLSRLENSINRFLIPENERGKVFVEHDPSPLLKADSTARANFYAQMVQNGLMTRNEVRGRENLMPKDGGDMLTAQVNLTPLDKLGQQQEPPEPIEAEETAKRLRSV